MSMLSVPLVLSKSTATENRWFKVGTTLIITYQSRYNNYDIFDVQISTSRKRPK